jgi:murein DD-endopeptidase MepM/ murein hydrolase activator NlpD
MQSKLKRTNIVGKPLPFRARYFVTKNNMPRLRYVSLLSTLLIMSSVSLLSGKDLMAKSSAGIIDLTPSEFAHLAPSKIEPQSGGDHSQRGYRNHEESSTLELKNLQASIQGALQDDLVNKVAALSKNANNALNILKQQAQDNKNRKEAAKKQADEASKSVFVALKSGDTLTGLLRRNGVGASEAYRAVEALSKDYDPRKMKPGLKIEILFGEDRIVDNESYKTITMLDVPYNEIKSARVTLTPEGKFTSKRHEKEIVFIEETGAFEVELSLFGSAEKAGVPYSVVAEAMRIYSWSVDFQRDLRKGDGLELLYRKAIIKETGEETGKKQILFANLKLSDRALPIYRMEFKDGHADYFQEDGRSIRKALMRTPINGGRLSSGYGMRHHPVLGYNKMHKGVDFAAPTGTKIYAAGDGVIESLGRNGGYGNYIRIRHNSSLKTAYAHLHRFEKGLRKGDRVRQGDVIGRVGTTGRSTGPHLHYEVLANGRQVNPRSVKLPTGEKLTGDRLAALKTTVSSYQQRYAMINNQIRVADASSARGKANKFNE